MLVGLFGNFIYLRSIRFFVLDLKSYILFLFFSYLSYQWLKVFLFFNFSKKKIVIRKQKANKYVVVIYV